MRTKEDLFDLLKRNCEERMEDLFPKGIPRDIQSRYEREFERFRKTDAPEELYIYRVLSNLADSMQVPLIVHGTARNSLLTYLLGDGLVNPMKPYYYCKSCGHYERIPDYTYGVDAGPRFCLECGGLMHGEGFSLDERFVWGIDDTPKRIHFEYLSIIGFTEMARKNLCMAFNKRQVIPITDFNSKSGRTVLRGIGILPEERNNEINYDLTILDKGRIALLLSHEDVENMGITLVITSDSSQAQALYERIPRARSRYDMLGAPLPPSISKWKRIDWDGFLTEEELAVTSLLEPRSYEELVMNIVFAKRAMNRTLNSHRGYLIPSRDHLFRELLKYENDEDRAYEIAEYVGNGYAFNTERRQEWKQLCTTILMPLDLKKTCERFDSLGPEANILDQLLHVMI